MANKPILSICLTCRQPLAGNKFRRDQDKQRHDSCISCEDALESLRLSKLSDAKRKRKEYARKYYAAKAGKPLPIPTSLPSSAPQTNWIGGGYPG